MMKYYFLNDSDEYDCCFKPCNMTRGGKYEMTYFLNMQIYKPEENDLEEYLKGIGKACKEFKKDLETLEKIKKES